ncbi:MAG: protein kinase family protein [Alphaproteobacteria bacterium]|nr:protein kinase family protein [Alphaproteobacteria bacterium]
MTEADDSQQISAHEESSQNKLIRPSEPQGSEPQGDEQKEETKRRTNKTGSIVNLNQNLLIDDSKPMQQFNNGDSYAYAAMSQRDMNRRYVALVADHGQLPRWKSADGYESLADTSLLRLIDHGVVYWPLVGKQQYVFVYDASIGECIISPDGVNKSNWRQTGVSDYLIAPITRVLKTLEDRNFCHGSIRPENIFFSGRDKNRPVILGDCLSVYPLSSQPSLFMSVEKASAEPFGRGNGTSADDVYAFGMSLALLLCKNNELEGLSDKEILRRKIELGSYSAIIGAERLQTRYVELLRGLLYDEPSQRWTTEEIFSWLDGSRMTPPPPPRRAKANRPFIFQGKKYLFPDTLVLDLIEDASETLKAVDSGELAQWVEKAFNNKDINEKFVQAMERISELSSGKDNIDFTITQIVLALNPMLPIYYKGRVFTYDGIGGLMARTCYEGGNISVFKDAFLQNVMDNAVILKTFSQNEILILIKNFDVCRTILRQKKYGNSEEKCVYHLCRTAPCFSPKFKDHFVYSAESCLRSFEENCTKGGQIAIFMDSQGTAFFSVHETKLMERVMYDLSQPEKDSQIAGNLRFLATLQKKTRIQDLPAIAKVFLESLSGVYEVYNNIKLRKQIIDNVKKEADKGNLVGMLNIIDNYAARQSDAKAFKLAKREYKLLQYEYEQYNRRLANKKTYGVVDGQEAASLVSWVIATVITVMCVFAYVSGYRIF